MAPVDLNQDGRNWEKIMTRRNWTLRLTGGLAAFVAGSSRPARGASAYTLTPINNGMQVKTPDGRVVFEYMLKNPGNIGLTAPSAACFHPVYTPSGERITTIDPKNHPHHRGIWIGWHSSEFRTPEPVRADFWGWGSFAPRNGRIIENKSSSWSAPMTRRPSSKSATRAWSRAKR